MSSTTFALICLTFLAAYLTSLWYCVSNSEWLATIVLHIFLAPLGVLHGFFVWFDSSWF